jgi:hypothetical protein
MKIQYICLKDILDFEKGKSYELIDICNNMTINYKNFNEYFENIVKRRKRKLIKINTIHTQS